MNIDPTPNKRHNTLNRDGLQKLSSGIVPSVLSKLSGAQFA